LRQTHVDPLQRDCGSFKRPARVRAGSTQAEPPCQHFKRIPSYLLRLLAKLTAGVRIMVRIHPTLECFGISGSVEEPRRYASERELRAVQARMVLNDVVVSPNSRP